MVREGETPPLQRPKSGARSDLNQAGCRAQESLHPRDTA